MPIYEFDCVDCNNDFQKLVHRISAIDEVTCPDCGSPNIKKKLSIFSSKIASTSSVASTSSNSSASCAPGGG